MEHMPTVGAFWVIQLKRLLGSLAAGCWSVIFFCVFLLTPAWRSRKDTLVWCPLPYRPFRDWAIAMRSLGWKTVTVVDGSWFPVSTPEEFDRTMTELVPWCLRFWAKHVKHYCAFQYVLRHAAVMHTAMGGPLESTPLWRFESFFLRRAGIRTICTPLGSESYPSSSMFDLSLRHGFLRAFPGAAREEWRSTRNIAYWAKHADVIISSSAIDALPRFDVLTPNPCVIDVAAHPCKQRYLSTDGTNGSVRILHAPSFRGYKGTEFIVKAVSELRDEGLQIEFDLLEKVPRSVVLEHMLTADIFADELIVTGYGFAAIEAMATGLPVLSNAEREDLTRLFRRYSFLDESPIVSSSPETVKKNLRALITNPSLRETLGRAGRAYAEKYHSHDAARFLFDTVYGTLLRGESTDLLRLYHPLDPSLPQTATRIRHPLVDNHLPVL